MVKKMYNLYTDCFPDYPVTLEDFHSNLKPDYAELYRKYDRDKLIGYCLVHDNSISMLCVAQPYRGKGLAEDLLKQAEKGIAKKNFKQILLGRGKDYLMQGVPLESKGAVEFFTKQGYHADWTSVNMTLKLGDYCPERIDIPKCEDVIFRLADRSEKGKVIEAVGKVIPEWQCYFENDEYVLVADLNDEIVGFEIISAHDGLFKKPVEKLGSIGCVGIIPEARCKGIGLRMVKAGADLLRMDGCTGVELRYVQLVDWYAKLGFVADKKMWMGEKDIK